VSADVYTAELIGIGKIRIKLTVKKITKTFFKRQFQNQMSTQPWFYSKRLFSFFNLKCVATVA
jgi:hypothetical protein